MATKTQGTIVYMQTALGSAISISGITNANPAVVTATGHGLTNGTVVKITGVVGMQEVNNRAFVVAGATTNTFQLSNVNSTNYTAYGSGGSVYAATLSAIGEVKEIPSIGGTEPNEIDVSHLLSVAEEKVAVLPRQSAASFTVFFGLSTANHSALLEANRSLSDLVFSFNKPSSFVATLVAQVSGINVTPGDVNSVLTAQIQLTPRAAVTWTT